jgi:phosphoglycerate kinase
MTLPFIRQVKQLAGKRVLVRVDFNVPVKRGRVINDFKLVRSLATIEYLVSRKARVILVSHLGRPIGLSSKLSLLPVAKRLSDLMQQPISLLQIRTKKDWQTTQNTINTLENGEVVMLENIRFLKDEEAEGVTLSKALANLADIFVLDGFAVAHRRAASVTGITKYLPSYAGLLLFEEINVLTSVFKRPKRPMVLILGGAKTETKIPVLQKFLTIADYILVGGGIANTYFAAEGKKLGDSLFDSAKLDEVQKICRHKKIVLPVDVVVGKANGTGAKIVPIDQLVVTNGKGVYDVGPETTKQFAAIIKKAKTLIWNGALGFFEQHPYQYGTYAIARLFAARSQGKSVGVAGGGETIEILEKLKIRHEIDLVSTGGGAMLEFLSGRKLPGLEALQNKHN